jgi:tetratricopeptide (TPR) repeat protein
LNERRDEVERHLDAATLASLGTRERWLLVHVAACSCCRRRLSANGRHQRAWTPKAAANAAILRLLQDLEVETDVASRLAAIHRERREGAARARELLACPDIWGTAATEPRYVSLEVAWQLLRVAAEEEPMPALRLVDVAGELATSLVARDPAASLNRQLLVEVRCARAHRLLDLSDRSAAARELRRAASQLAPDLRYGRALYCLALARLRREQGQWEEAVAVADRAVQLLEAYGTTLETGQAQLEQAWALIETGDPEEAEQLLEAALPLVAGAPRSEIIARLGLAVARTESSEGCEGIERGERGAGCELGGSESVGGLLAAADRLTAQVLEPGIRLRLHWLGAQAARRCGRHGRALRRLRRVVAELLTRGEDHAAARALLELLALSLERRWQRVFKMRGVQVALDVLFESTQLHPRARAVIGLLAYVLHDPGRRRAAEVVPRASRYLARSRYRPDLPFQPTHGRPLVHLEWDDLELCFRAGICAEVGAEEEIGRRPGKDLESDLRDFISWRYEVLRCVRIEFTAQEGRT